MFGCLTSSAYNMTATVLTQGVTQPDTEGQWVSKQDPDTGEIIRVWIEDSDSDTAGTQIRTINLTARGVIDGGLRSTGTSEQFTRDGLHRALETIKIKFPAGTELNARDRITNIKNRDGIVLWKEEEFNNAPTIFDVMGVTPIMDPFGQHIENFAMLQRAQVQ